MLFDRPAFPIVVIVGMSQPVKKKGKDTPHQSRIRDWNFKERILGEGKLPHSVQSVGALRHRTVQRVLSKARGPGLVEPLLESSTLVGPSVVIVAGRDHRTDPGQVWRMRDGSQDRKSVVEGKGGDGGGRR